MKLNSGEFSTSQRWSADVCIMGAGVAGITLATALAAKGCRVVILDAGGDRHDADVQAGAKADKVSWPYPDPEQSRLRRLGGASNHWANNTSPLSAIDFEVREGLPNSGWPITLDDLLPYYPAAAGLCGTGEDGYDLNHWLNTFGMSATLPPEKRQTLTLAVAKAAVPPTQFYNAHGAYLDNSDKITLITYAQVTNITFNPSSKQVEQVEFSGKNSVSHQVEAREVIMAFGGLENARMLLHFNQRYNNQLGNQGDSVGRYFMDHPTLRAAQLYTTSPEAFKLFAGEMPSDYRRFVLNYFELSEQKLREHQLTNIRLPLIMATRQQMSHGISSFHMLRDRLAGKVVSNTLAADLTNVVMDLDVVVDTVSRKAFSRPLFDSVDDFGGFEVPMMIEQTPHRDNRIYLSSKQDKFGIPLLSVDWTLHEDDKSRLWRGLDLFASEIGALGLGRVRLLREQSSRIFGDQIGFGHHHMGTTRMSTTPANGVVDAQQRVFGADNLFVAGCSVFATGGHVPPTLTIVATSLRLADILAKRLGKAL